MPVTIAALTNLAGLAAGNQPVSILDNNFAAIRTPINGLVPLVTEIPLSLIGATRGAVGATASNTTYTVSAATLVAIYNATSLRIDKVQLSQGSLTVDIATQGRNGLDYATPVTASTWHYLYHTWDGATMALRLSKNAPPAGPTLANGETGWAFICPLMIDGASHFLSTHLTGDVVAYDAPQSVLSNGASAVANTAITITGFVPPAASCSSYVIYAQWDGTTDGAGVVNMSVRLKHTSGSVYATGNMNANGLGALTVQFLCTGVHFVMPNTQALFYDWGVGSGTDQHLNVSIASYRVVNGG